MFGKSSEAGLSTWTLDKVQRFEGEEGERGKRCYILWLGFAEPQYIASPRPLFSTLPSVDTAEGRLSKVQVYQGRQLWEARSNEAG